MHQPKVLAGYRNQLPILSHSLDLSSGTGIGRLAQRSCYGFNAIARVIATKKSMHVCMFAHRDIDVGEDIIVQEEAAKVSFMINIQCPI